MNVFNRAAVRLIAHTIIFSLVFGNNSTYGMFNLNEDCDIINATHISCRNMCPTCPDQDSWNVGPNSTFTAASTVCGLILTIIYEGVKKCCGNRADADHGQAQSAVAAATPVLPQGNAPAQAGGGIAGHGVAVNVLQNNLSAAEGVGQVNPITIRAIIDQPPYDPGAAAEAGAAEHTPAIALAEHSLPQGNNAAAAGEAHDKASADQPEPKKDSVSISPKMGQPPYDPGAAAEAGADEHTPAIALAEHSLPQGNNAAAAGEAHDKASADQPEPKKDSVSISPKMGQPPYDPGAAAEAGHTPTDSPRSSADIEQGIVDSAAKVNFK